MFVYAHERRRGEGRQAAILRDTVFICAFCLYKVRMREIAARCEFKRGSMCGR